MLNFIVHIYLYIYLEFNHHSYLVYFVLVFTDTSVVIEIIIIQLLNVEIHQVVLFSGKHSAEPKNVSIFSE